MTRWLVRGIVLVLGPAMGWLHVARTPHGFLVGLLCSILVLLGEIVINRIPLDNLVAGTLGAILGLIAAKMLDYAVYMLNDMELYLRVHKYSTLMTLLLAYLGLVVAIRKKEEVELLDRNIFVPGAKRKGAEPLILDTSVVIDGRIVDVCKTNFLGGSLIVPKFVLSELHALSDSSDSIKRQRGRRGLDILAHLQSLAENPVTLYDKDFADEHGVDVKLVALAHEISGRIVTTDFNLNKVASLQGIKVLNINDLANALKAVVLPGENMNVVVVKEGKEKDQGIAYLDDGTMVVVEEGRKLVGKRVEVCVSSILQTSAGRMIFTRLRDHPA